MKKSELNKHTFVVNVSMILWRQVNSKYQVFIAKRSEHEDKNPGKWGVPGGKVDIEDGGILAAVKREVEEEVAIRQIEKTEYLTSHMTVSDKGEQKLYIFFTGTTNQTGSAWSDEVAKVQWVTFDELAYMESEDFTPNMRTKLMDFLKDKNQ